MDSQAFWASPAHHQLRNPRFPKRHGLWAEARPARRPPLLFVSQSPAVLGNGQLYCPTADMAGAPFSASPGQALPDESVADAP